MKKHKLKKNQLDTAIYDGKYFSEGHLIFIPTSNEVTQDKEINTLIGLGIKFQRRRGLSLSTSQEPDFRGDLLDSLTSVLKPEGELPMKKFQRR